MMKIAFLLLLLLFCATGAQAQLVEIQPLSFGRVLLKNNATNHSITLQTSGAYSTSSSDIIVLDAPQVGIYQISGLMPNMAIASVDIVQTAPLRFMASNIYNMDNFTTIAPATDGGGQTTITVGGRASTNGSGFPYVDGPYTGTIEITVNQ